MGSLTVSGQPRKLQVKRYGEVMEPYRQVVHRARELLAAGVAA